MSADEKQRLLIESERKRAALIAEVTRLQIELEKERKSGGGGVVSAPGSPSFVQSQSMGESEEVRMLRSQLTNSEAQRVALMRELDAVRGGADSNRATAGVPGTGTSGLSSGLGASLPGAGDSFSISAVPQATNEDFQFDEEEAARVRAEEVMGQLLHSVNQQRESQEQLAKAQLEIAELRGALDAATVREASLNEMLERYRGAWRRALETQKHMGTVIDGNYDIDRFDDGSDVASVLSGQTQHTAATTTATANATTRERLLEAKVKELTDQLSYLRLNLHSGSPRGRATVSKEDLGLGASPAANAINVIGSPTSELSATASSAQASGQEVHWLVREQQLLAAIEKMKTQLKSKNASIRELKNVLRVQLQHQTGASPGVAGSPSH